VPPLTAFCVKLAAPENLLGMADGMTAKQSGRIDNRVTVLSLAIMGAAGDFTNGLRWDEQPMWQGSSRYLRDTNSDVITAEAIVWLTFLMGRLWKADQRNDREMFERVGFVTVMGAHRLTLSMVESQTGVDFTARARERGGFYLQAEKDKVTPFEPFASVVLSSIGCRSLGDEPMSIGPLPPPEWTPLSMYVATFFSTMPHGFYGVFKRMLQAWPERFPSDDESEAE
jgi:hypothetical protein